MKKQQCNGLFVRKDRNGNDICVGDAVKIIRPAFSIDKGWEEEAEYHEECIWIGQVRLWLSRGIVVVTNGNEVVNPPLTNNSTLKWEWELIYTEK